MKSTILLKILMPFFFLLTAFTVVGQTITTTGTLSALSTTYGTASTETSFTVEGPGPLFTQGILVTAPAGFEVSLTSGSAFGASVTTTFSVDNVPLQTIYVRLKADAAVSGSPYSGNIVLTHPGSSTVNVATVSSTVSAKGITISGLTANNKVYNATNTATLSGTAALSGVELWDAGNVTLAGSPTSTFADANVGTGKAVTVTGYSITGSAAGNYSLSQPAGLTADITTKGLTISGITASNKTYNGNTSATLTGTATLVGVEAGDVGNVTVAGGTGTFASANVGTGIAVTVTGYTLSGTAAGNYTVAQPSGLTADITAKGLTISGITASNKVYDATTAATLSGTATLVGVETSDVANVTLGGTAAASFANANVGVAKPVTVTGYSITGSAIGNYTLAQPSGLTADITPAPLTITADSVRKYHGETITTPATGVTAFTSTGLQNGETIGSVTMTYGTGAAAGDPLGLTL